jgi:ABC-type bacteriocin/lantibiotic exporter with double-glycine peptidase domain
MEERFYKGKGTYLKNCERSIQPDNLSCGVHAVNTILKYYNKNVATPDLIRLLGTNEDGTDTEPILNVLSGFNLNIEINETSSPKDIINSVRQGYPMLITIDDWEHWVVIYGYSDRGIFLLDSNRKNFHCHWQYGQFLERWDDNWIAIVKPT